MAIDSAPRFVRSPEGFEFDFAVTQDVGIGRATGLIFLDEVFEHLVPVFRGKIDRFQFDAKFVGTAWASARSSIAVQYSVPSSSSQFFINKPVT